MFRKTARVDSLGTFDVERDGLIRIAQRAPEESRSSYFLDGARKLDVRDLLARTAELYAISDDPSHYFFEAIRANTANCPNENNDGFHQDELLHFNTKLGMPVYFTYSGKPHHLNHRTENPKAARGLIIDAHYNTDAPALEHCPACNTRTAETQNRDRTGMHCKKCGTLVRDEFVEILVGIDAKKDPLFAEGVRKGTLKSGSMGCNCLSTTCNVCAHVAYARPEFCEHIRAGNKGSLWLRKGNGWTKTSSADVAKELRRRRIAYVPQDFCYVSVDGFEARKAFEYCNNVIFDEYSRVDQPADPKALQVEILKAAQLEGAPAPDALRSETEALIRSAEKKRKEMEAAMSRSAQRLPGRQPPTVGRPGLAPLTPDVGPGYIPPPSSLADPTMDQHGVGIQLEQGDDPVVIEPPGSPGMPGEEMPGADPNMPGGPTDIEQYTDQQVAPPGGPGQPPPGEEMDMGEMGVLPVPPGASAPRRGERKTSMRKFSAAYAQWKVQVSEQGNARLLTAAREPVLVFKAKKAMRDPEERKVFGLEVLAHLLDHGLVATAKQYGAFFSPKFASVVDHARDDMKQFEDKAKVSSPLQDATDDMQGDLRGSPPSKTTTDGRDDMDGDVRGTPPGDTQTDGVRDHHVEDQNLSGVATEDHSTMREKRKPISVGKDDVLEGEVHDHTEPLRGKKGERVTEISAAIVGKRVAQKLGAASFEVTAARVGEKGLEFELTGPDQRIHHVAATMLEQWFLLDKGPSVMKLPGQPAMVSAGDPNAPAPRLTWTASQVQALREQGVSIDANGAIVVQAEFEKCSDCGKPMFGGKDKHSCAGKDDDSGEKDAALVQAKLAHAARLEKLANAKLAKAKEEVAKAKAEAGELNQVVAKATVEAFARALRIAAARQAADLEESPLKMAAEAVLSEPRTIGKDAATGEPIEYAGFDPELTRYLVAQIYEVGHGDHLEQLFRRAAELMAKGDQYLIDAEADLKNLSRTLPAITQARVAQFDEDAIHAAELRRQANSGNLRFNPAPSEEGPVNNGHDKRGAIRNALGGTLVEAARGRLGLN